MTSLPTISYQLLGESPLLCHNGQTADPRNTYAKAMKAISGKRKKTDADLDELARLEWFAGLYVDDKRGLVIPSHVLKACFVNGAKKSKRGPQTKSGLFVADHAVLDFTGKPDQINEETLNELFHAGDHHLTCGVKVGMAKVMRTRPQFIGWSLTVGIQYDPDLLNPHDIQDILTDAGRQVGLGDWRPEYGRFTVKVAAEPKPEVAPTVDTVQQLNTLLSV